MEVIRGKFRLAAEKTWLQPAVTILLNPVYKRSRLKIGNAKGTSRPVVLPMLLVPTILETNLRAARLKSLTILSNGLWHHPRASFFASGLGNVAASRCMVLWRVVGRCEPSSCASCPDKQAFWL